MSEARISARIVIKNGEIVKVEIDHATVVPSVTGRGFLTEATRSAAIGVNKLLSLLRRSIAQQCQATTEAPDA